MGKGVKRGYEWCSWIFGNIKGTCRRLTRRQREACLRLEGKWTGWKMILRKPEVKA